MRGILGRAGKQVNAGKRKRKIGEMYLRKGDSGCSERLAHGFEWMNEVRIGRVVERLDGGNTCG